MNTATLGFLLGLAFGAFVGLGLAGLMSAARKGDDLAEVHQLERNHARLRRVLGGDEAS